jgi:hypothetical protein
MLSTIQGSSLLTIMEIVGPVVLLLGQVHGALRAGRRPRRTVERVSEAVTREHYKKDM